MNRLFEIFVIPFFLLMRLFVYRSEYAFYSFYGFKGNTRYLFELINKNHSLGISCTYLYDSDNVIILGKSKVINELSFIEKFVFFLSVKRLFLTHGIGSLPLYVYFIDILQLWHGVPIKKILCDCNNDIKPFGFFIFNFLYSMVYRFRLGFYNMVYVPKDYPYLSNIESAFNKSNKNLLHVDSLSKVYIGENFDVNKSYETKPKVIYCPTWRDGSCHAVKSAIGLIEVFAKQNIDLHVKLHPYDNANNFDKYDVPANIKSKFIMNDVDMVDCMTVYDLFITDYSSFIFDLPKNVDYLLYATDFDEYLSSRDIYEDFIALYEKNLITSETELIYEVINKKNGNIVSFGSDNEDTDINDYIVKFLGEK